MSNGRVVGGHYLDGTVSTTVIGSVLVVQSGLKRRKLTDEEVASWQEIISEPKAGMASAVGQAVVGAVLPRFMSKSASAAVGAALDTSRRSTHLVRVDWVDGKQSLLKLPEELFTHLELMLERLQSEPDTSAVVAAAEAAASAPAEQPSLAEQALTQVAGLLRDKIPSPRKLEPKPLESTPRSEIAEQLTTLSELRGTGILTEDEFAAKKAELLARL